MYFSYFIFTFRADKIRRAMRQSLGGVSEHSAENEPTAVALSETAQPEKGILKKPGNVINVNRWWSNSELNPLPLQI